MPKQFGKVAVDEAWMATRCSRSGVSFSMATTVEILGHVCQARQSFPVEEEIDDQSHRVTTPATSALYRQSAHIRWKNYEMLPGVAGLELRYLHTL